MSLITCENCGYMISDKAKECPQCGIKRNIKRNNKVFMGITAVVTVIIVIIFAVGDLNVLKPSIEKVKDSVVKIEAYDEDETLLGTGSGFCAFQSNYVITNFHVIEGARNFRVITDDQTIYEVRNIVLYNKKEDLVILDINGSLAPLDLSDGKKHWG